MTVNECCTKLRELYKAVESMPDTVDIKSITMDNETVSMVTNINSPDMARSKYDPSDEKCYIEGLDTPMTMKAVKEFIGTLPGDTKVLVNSCPRFISYINPDGLHVEEDCFGADVENPISFADTTVRTFLLALETRYGAEFDNEHFVIPNPKRESPTASYLGSKPALLYNKAVGMLNITRLPGLV